MLHRGDSRAVVASFYREALELLDTRGFKRSHEQTSMEFALSLGSHPAGMPFLALTRLYNEVRFGPPEVCRVPSEAASFLRLMRDALRPSNRNSLPR